MASVSLFSLFAHGLNIHEIRVEVDISSGLPGFHIVGLAGTVVQESKDRIRAALVNSGFEWPRGKITVNLAPADLHKISSSFDLPIALGILTAQKLLPATIMQRFFIVGELGLNGSIRGLRHMFLFAEWAARQEKALILPPEAVPLLQHVSSSPSSPCFYGAHFLQDLVTSLKTHSLVPLGVHDASSHTPQSPEDFILDGIVGHTHAKRGLEIAAVGRHHMCLWGPPGAGKTVLARGLHELLPALMPKEARDVRRIHSLRAQSALSGELTRPFRAPHHSVSLAALLGGGTSPMPGEISLAHHGILFLDELAEFPRGHIDALRQPLADAIISIGRAKYTCTFPAYFQLIAATNPCPCGYYGDLEVPCTCYDTTRAKYLSKLSGPLLDRIDLHLHIRRQPAKALLDSRAAPYTSSARDRISTAQHFRATRPHAHISISIKELSLFHVAPNALAEASRLADARMLSGRSLLKLLSVARSVADLELSELVKKPHLEEAWSFKEPIA